jgi:hypothetical protein
MIYKLIIENDVFIEKTLKTKQFAAIFRFRSWIILLEPEADPQNASQIHLLILIV